MYYCLHSNIITGKQILTSNRAAYTVICSSNIVMCSIITLCAVCAEGYVIGCVFMYMYVYMSIP